MDWLAWCIVIVPLVFILGAGFYSRKYVRDVADYLAAGRVAGRYVISIGDMQASIGVITLVAAVEQQYQCGFALQFWNGVLTPLFIFMALTGYCTYRFRATRCLSVGQFFEMRYNRHFRIFAASLRTLADTMTNAIGPAVAARFFIYFLGIPHQIELGIITVPTFALLILGVLILAMMVIWPGGRISLIITDSFQGLISYPIFVIITVFILTELSWYNEIAPAMMNRVGGESFLNPRDIAELRDFNIFALVVMIINSVLNRASWIGNDTSNCGRSPHEQKMAGIIGAWRLGFCIVMITVIAAAVITMMSHRNYQTEAHQMRLELTDAIAGELVANPALRTQMNAAVAAVPATVPENVFSQADNPDTRYLNAVHQVLKQDEKEPGAGNAKFQEFRTLYHQMLLPEVFRNLLPSWLMGLFCLLMIMLMLSTDDSRIFNISATVVQDVVMPLRKKPFTLDQHLKYLRWYSVGIAVVFFCASLFLSQLDYINMFLTIMASIWNGGAGPVMIFGLYSRFGTTAGAYASIFTGSGISIGGVILQRYWASFFYPSLTKLGWVDMLASVLETVSSPFAPYVVWVMDPVKFPINSAEITFLAMGGGLIAYVSVSLLTYRQPFNLDKMLHRGVYADGEISEAPPRWSWRNCYNLIVGITPECTRTDKIIIWSVFTYSIIYQFVICFLVVLVWNWLSPWPDEWWSTYFLIVNLIVASVLGVVSTVWFLWGGSMDLKALFRDLKLRRDDPNDDGRVPPSAEG